uniref:Calcium permeable stress-gated cation channel 1 n=1 Tax=Peronospora matthiolae TaxID=2874970 RepID=A0AAV1T3H8_9STRA
MQVTTQAAANVLLTSVTVYFTLFLVLILVYEVLRPRLAHVYAPENLADFPQSKQRKFLSWVPFMWSIDESDVAEKCGLDAWVLLRFMQMGRKVALLCVLCSLALFPMYFCTAAVIEAQEQEKHHHVLSQLLPASSGVSNASTVAIASMIMLMLEERPDSKNSAPHSLLADGKLKLDVVDRLTIANVGKDDWRLYFTVFVAYILSCYVMRLLLNEYTVYRKRRHEFLMRKHPQQYSVVISDLPQAQRRPQTLQAYLEFLFPDSVHSVYIGVECAALEKVLEKRRMIVYHLYAANVQLTKAKTKAGDYGVIQRPKECIGRRFFGLCGGGKKVDAVDYYSEKLQKVEAEIVRVRNEILQCQSAEKDQEITRGKQYGSKSAAASRRFSSLTELTEKLRATKSSMRGEESLPLLHVSMPMPKRPNVMRSSAFVSFRSIRSAQAAQQLLQVENPRCMLVLPAPNICDVQWENFGLPHKLKAKWKLVSMGVSLLIGCFWTVPTAFVASMASVDELRHLFPWLGGLMEKNSWLLIVLQQTAPLVYSAMNGLANVIFRQLSTQEGHLSISEVEASRFTKLCFFQAFQMFFVSALAGSIITEFMLILDQPRLLFFFLGNTIANQSMMFITFIITQLCVNTSLFLLRVSPLVISAAYRVLAPMHAKLPRPREWMGLCPINFRTDLDTPMNLAQQYLVFLFVVVFAPIAPLVGYFGALFFVVSELSYKRCLFFVNSSHWAANNSMGVYWPPLYSFVIGALIIGQCTLIGLLSLKSGGYGPIGLTTMLPFITLAFHWYAVDLSRLNRAAENLPLDQCCDVDEERKDDSFDFLNGIYRQPAMIEAFSPAFVRGHEFESGTSAAIDATYVQGDAVEPQVEPLDKPVKPLNQQTRLAELNNDKKGENKGTE